jgi:hypothetical protein
MKGSLTFFDLGKIRFDNIQNSIWVHENEESACARGGEASERFILGNQVASLASNREPYCSENQDENRYIPCGDALQAVGTLAGFLDERMCVPRDMGTMSAACLKKVAWDLQKGTL